MSPELERGPYVYRFMDASRGQANLYSCMLFPKLSMRFHLCRLSHEVPWGCGPGMRWDEGGESGWVGLGPCEEKVRVFWPQSKAGLSKRTRGVYSCRQAGCILTRKQILSKGEERSHERSGLGPLKAWLAMKTISFFSAQNKRCSCNRTPTYAESQISPSILSRNKVHRCLELLILPSSIQTDKQNLESSVIYKILCLPSESHALGLCKA